MTVFINVIIGIFKLQTLKERINYKRYLKKSIKRVNVDIEMFLNDFNKDMSQHDKILTMKQIELLVKHRTVLINELNRL